MVEQHRRVARFLTPLGLFALALGVRCLTWPRVMPEGPSGPIFLFGTDAYYHMRRVLYTLANFPEVLRVDPYINFPYGGEPI
jgi:asparagine N-glycosylation enzyme membrane subunit Stt3